MIVTDLINQLARLPADAIVVLHDPETSYMLNLKHVDLNPQGVVELAAYYGGPRCPKVSGDRGLCQGDSSTCA